MEMRKEFNPKSPERKGRERISRGLTQMARIVRQMIFLICVYQRKSAADFLAVTPRLCVKNLP